MAYLDQAQQGPQPGAITAVVAIHAAVGALLVTGLAVTYVQPDTVPNPVATDTPDVIVKIPPEPQPDPAQELPKAAPDPYIPPVDSPIPPSGPPISASDTPSIIDTAPVVIPQPGPGTLPTAAPIIAIDPGPPIAAAPRNGNWVTQSDYRSSWIRQERVGTASFSLDIGANGRVQDCSITRSSGHSVLDTATCRLVTRRARFDAARNPAGDKVPGNYTGSVRWELPE